MTTLYRLIKVHQVELIAIGNGTASRETERFAKEVIKAIEGNKPQTVVVSEAGASVYSASELAAAEFLSSMCPCVVQCPLHVACKIR